MFSKFITKLKELIMKEIKHGKTKKVKVCDIVPYDNNYVIHSPEQIDKIKRSIEEFGYRQRLGIWRKNILIYGHCRLSALIQINPQMTIEVDDLSDLSENKVDRLRIMDNSLKSDDIDDSKLHAELQKIFPNLNDNITNIQETMSIDISHIAKKMDAEMANVPKNADLPEQPTLSVNDDTAERAIVNHEPKPAPPSQKLVKIILEYYYDDYAKVKELTEKASVKFGVTSSSDLFLKMLESN